MIAFGTIASSVVNSTGTVNVTCTGSASYTIALSAGRSGSYAPRQMSSGTNKLNYNIYKDSAHATVWGNGISGTSTNSGSFTFRGGKTSFTAYGQVPAQALPAPSPSYSDSITVTVTY